MDVALSKALTERGCGSEQSEGRGIPPELAAPSRLLWATGIFLEIEVSYWQINRAFHGLKSPGALTHGTHRSDFHDVRLFSNPAHPIPGRKH